jgi:hypothetical protein
MSPDERVQPLHKTCLENRGAVFGGRSLRPVVDERESTHGGGGPVDNDRR